MKRLLALLFLPFSTHAQESDVERIYAGLPENFEETAVQIYPLVDQRCLADLPINGTTATLDSSPEIWDEFLAQLKSLKHLKITTPQTTVRKIQTRRNNAVLQESLKKIQERAYADYREVRLDAAIESLEIALQGYLDLEYQIAEPREVARIALTLGLATLEKGDTTKAAEAFEQALLIDPCLRLRPGYDHPKAVEAFEEVRKAMLQNPPMPSAFTTHPKDKTHILRSRLLPNGELAVVLQSRSNLQFDQQSPSPDGASRLASRVNACLPFGRIPKTRSNKNLYIDAGFSLHTFLERTVDIFPNYGFSFGSSYFFNEHTGLDVRASILTSGHDQAENLRKPLSSARIAFAPSFQFTPGKFRIFGGIGIEASYLGERVTTTNVACKYFSESDNIPRDLCDFKLDVHRRDPSFLLGTAAHLGATFSFTRTLALGLRTETAWYAIDSAESKFNLPLGGQIYFSYLLF